jgi:D-3-phosphoglycerate dehydrogenase
MKILIADAFDAALPGRLAPFGEVFTDMARLAEAEVLLVRSKTTVTKELLAGAPALKLVIRGGVGTDNIDKPACKERGIEVRNTPKASSVAVAELAMALMLAIPSQVVPAHNGMVAGKFLKNELKRTELFRKTLGLIGVGLIGSEVAKRAAAFGMKVVGFDPGVKTHPVVELKASLDEVLAEAHYLSLHAPLTDQTRGMINAAAIAKMKDGVTIINTGRGKCVVEEDLAAALASGKVRAYGADVWYSDPPDPACPLLGAPNVLMCPHLGASTKENLGRIGDEVVEMLGNWKV